LEKLRTLLVNERVWFTDLVKHSRMVWEGLFFMFWHADKDIYQRDVALKISALIGEIESLPHWGDKQKLWVESCFYILQMHWHKVDNFRINKFLMLIRFTVNQCF
jgi:ribosomal RNA-processing protein 1